MNLKNFASRQGASFGWIGLLLLLVLAGTYLLRPISDPDFFWHLKTGEWIWQQGSLPTFDTFTFTGPQSPDRQQLFILRSYPLAQLLYYGLHQTFGWAGIFALRVLVAAAFLTLLLARFALGGAKDRSNLLAGGLLLLFCTLFIESYPLDRPQIFSFLFLGGLLLMYDLAVRRQQERPLLTIALPTFLLTAAWGNFHSGYLVGMAVLLLLGGVEAALFLCKRRSRSQGIALGAFVLSGVAGGFFNQNRPDLALLSNLFAVKPTTYNNEYFSTLRFYQNFGDQSIILLWLFMALVALLIVVALREPDNLAESLLLLALGTYAFLYIRHVPFFLMAAIPFVYNQLLAKKLPRFLPYLLSALCLASFLFYAQDECKNGQQLAAKGAISREMPVAAADFIVKANLRGRIFNSYGWGGYLLWRLGPERQIYQDGRGLNQTVVLDWLSSLMGMKSGSGRFLWQEILDKYRIDLAVLPKNSEENPGQAHELAVAMSRNPEWKVEYYDELSIVFSRRR